MKRTVVVTGANSGIGLQTALELARAGFDVIGTVRSRDKEQELAEAAGSAAVSIRAEMLDVTDRQACRRLVEGIDLYALVNNAGYMNVGAVEDVDPDEALRQLDALVVAPMYLATLAGRGMRRRGEGRIVNVSSVAAHVTGPFLGWYQACKHALDAVMEALRAEMAPFGIDVISIEPGAFRTGIWGKAADDLIRRKDGSVHAEPYERILDYMPDFEARVADPARVAGVIGSALTAGKPRHRYLVGVDAPVLELANLLLPPTLQDRVNALMVRAVARLPRKSEDASPDSEAVQHGS